MSSVRDFVEVSIAGRSTTLFLCNMPLLLVCVNVRKLESWDTTVAVQADSTWKHVLPMGMHTGFC